MKQDREIVIQELEEITQRLIKEVEQFKALGLEQLNRKASVDNWSALECLDHLNQYGDFYIPEITAVMKNATQSSGSSQFKFGWLGNYFAKMMLPKEGMKKMKSPKDKLPSHSELGIETINKFLEQQFQLLDLLKNARNYNIGKLKCAISISKLIKLKLVDTLRFVIYHNWRHVEQAKRSVKEMV